MLQAVSMSIMKSVAKSIIRRSQVRRGVAEEEGLFDDLDGGSVAMEEDGGS